MTIKFFMVLIFSTLFLSAAVAAAEAQDAVVLSTVVSSIATPDSRLPVRERALKLAIMMPGVSVCYADGVDSLYASKADAQKAVYNRGELHHVEVSCVRYAQQ